MKQTDGRTLLISKDVTRRFFVFSILHSNVPSRIDRREHPGVAVMRPRLCLAARDVYCSEGITASNIAPIDRK